MSRSQIFRVMLARKWMMIIISSIIAAVGIAVTLSLPKTYTAESSLLVEIRVDPALGTLAPALASPGYVATQIEILKSDRVAARVVQMLGIDKSEAMVKQWREDTKAKISLERYFSGILGRGLVVEPSRGGSLIELKYTSQDPLFAQSAANAFAQAYMDVSVELRTAPARTSEKFLSEEAKARRAALEEAQSRLSKYQQATGIVVSDERLDQETSRYNALAAQLATAQTDMLETSSRSRNSGGDASPDVLLSAAVQGLKSQISTAEAKLTEISAIVGKNHPARLQLEAQLAELKQQMAVEVRRVSGGASLTSRGSAQKVAEIKALMDDQKKHLLAMRADRDKISVYVRDVEEAQREYSNISTRVGAVSLESNNSQANTRLLSPAVEPGEPTSKRVITGVLLSVIGGLALATLAVVGLEVIDRRIRNEDDMFVMAGVPVIGVLRAKGSKQPAFRKLMLPGMLSTQQALPALGRTL